MTVSQGFCPPLQVVTVLVSPLDEYPAGVKRHLVAQAWERMPHMP